MAGRRTALGAWLQIDEGEARRLILASAVTARGCVRDMAKELGVSECTLHRTITRLEIRDEVKRAGVGVAA